jgi:serine protease Do
MRLDPFFSPRFAVMLNRRHCRAQWAAMLGGLVALLGSMPAPAESPSPATFIPLSGSVVRVEVDREHGGLSLGTGVTIAPSVVVTNCHVTRDGTAARIAGSGMLWEVSAQYADTQHDLCFLRVPGWRGKPVVLGVTEGLHLGQRVAALGFTGGTGITLTFGRVLALHWLDAANVVESDTGFTSGASGGGLFDATGSLVGLLTFRLRGSSGSFYSLPAEWIRDRMPTEDQWTEVAPLRGAHAFWQADTEALPYFMRAPLLDADGQWDALLELSGRWTSAYPKDAEPLLVRGRALQKLDRPRAAVVAFADALRLTPDDPVAWHGLALAYASLGDDVALRGVEAKLGALSECLAAVLKARLAQVQDAK